MSILLCGMIRNAGHGITNGTILKLQRSHIPARRYLLKPAKPSGPRSGFGTAIRRPQQSRNAASSATTASTAATPPPALWEQLGPLASFFRFYGRSQAIRPYATQFVSSLFIFGAGDLGAQYIGGEPYDFKRTLRILAISAGSSIVIFRWFLYIAKNFNYSSKLLSLATKVAVNQIVYAPVFGTYYFAMQSFLSGDGGAKIWERVKTAMPASVKTSWMFWPPVTGLTFAFVPATYHAVLLSCVTTGWQTYLSWLNRKTEKTEIGGGAEAAAS